MTRDEVLDVFLGVQDELVGDINIRIGRFDRTGGLIEAPHLNEPGRDVLMSFKATGDRERLDSVLDELRGALGRFLKMNGQYSGEYNCVIRLRDQVD